MPTNRLPNRLQHVVTMLALLGLVAALGGCVWYPPGGGGYYPPAVGYGYPMGGYGWGGGEGGDD